MKKPVFYFVGSFSAQGFHKYYVDNVYKFVVNVKTFSHEKTA